MSNSSDPKMMQVHSQILSRRTFLEVMAGLFAAYAGNSLQAQPRGGDATASAEAPRKIETPLCILRLEPNTGNLVGIRWKKPETEIIQAPLLGENFRLLLPRPHYQANYFLSSEQRVNRIEEHPDGVTCYYDALRNAREVVNVKVKYDIRAVESRVEFSIEVENSTDLPLAEVYYAIIGGLQGVGNRLDTDSLVPGLAEGTPYGNLAPAIFNDFHGYDLGIRYDATGFTYPGAMQMGWAEFYNRKTGLGLYYANHDPVSRLSALYMELRPFTKGAVKGDDWPTPADLPPGEPIGLTMGWLFFPYSKGSTFHSGPMALAVHQGDWHEGSEFYRQWFDQHFQVRRPPNWLRKEMAWQSVIISNPEDVVLYKFKDLPKLAADAKKYGVTTFEILGWNVGGIDRGYPQYTPDPRLGTPEEFRAALRDIKREGVHPLTFANIQVADTAIPQFKGNLERFTVRGRWAPDFPAFGWGEGTIAGRMGLVRSNMTLVSPAHPEFRASLLDQFAQLVKDGADGFQLDKTNALGTLDFNPRLTVPPDRSFTEEMLSTLKETVERMREVNPDFALASEIFWDRSFPYVDVSYVRMASIDMPSPALRYTFPEWTSTICAESPGDFNIVNNGMRYGLVWAVQPRHYNDSMDEPLTRPLSKYVQELIRIRAKHKDLLFLGRFRDTRGAEVKASEHVRYSVFEGMNGPGKACVVVNFGSQEETAEVTWPSGEGRLVEILKPFQADATGNLPVKLKLAPRTCAVIVEK
jgi:hypothetical protein